VNKADREGADRIKVELETMLQLRPQGPWPVPVLLTQADQGKGVPELLAAIEDHRAYLARSGRGEAKTAEGRREEFLQLLRDEVMRRLEVALDDGKFAALMQQIKRGEVDPYLAALRALESGEVAAALREGSA
jgi:LAO/AO transport system kinase